MSSIVTAAQWQMYKDVMRDAHDTFAQKPMVWRRLRSKLNRYGEDNTSNGYDDVTLMVQLNYNYMRSWPITQKTETGGLDRQSVQVLINKDYLRELGYINAQNYFDYDQSEDIFLIDGIKHIPMGDTPAAQMQDDDVFITMVLKRDESPTGVPR